MSDYGKCPTCKAYGWLDVHKCSPEWIVWDAEGGGEFLYRYESKRRYFANDAQQAAEQFGDTFDFESPNETEVYVITARDADKFMEQYEDTDIDVQDSRDEIEEKIIPLARKFSLESEVVRNFYATEIKTKETP